MSLNATDFKQPPPLSIAYDIIMARESLSMNIGLAKAETKWDATQNGRRP